MKSAPENVVADVVGQEHLYAIEHVEEMLRTICHITLMKFTQACVMMDTFNTCSKHYTTFQTSFRAHLSNMWL